MSVLKLETFLENTIEGFFNKRFAGTLEPVEIIKSLEREVEKNQREANGEVFAPEKYIIMLNGEDYQKLCAKRVQEAFFTAVAKQIIRKNCFVAGDLQVSLKKSARIEPNNFSVRSEFKAEAQGASTDENAAGHTLVLNREKFSVPLNLPVEHKLVSLQVIEGADVDSYLEFGERRIYIGRRDKSDFILTDESVSRLHAYITFDRYRHILHDAQSMNGSFVNGRSATECCLEDGDEIRLGNTILRYEVI